jgi:hypothetical protein
LQIYGQRFIRKLLAFFIYLHKKSIKSCFYKHFFLFYAEMLTQKYTLADRSRRALQKPEAGQGCFHLPPLHPPDRETLLAAVGH